MTAAQAQIVEIVSPAKDFLTQLSHTGWVCLETLGSSLTRLSSLCLSFA